MSILQTLNVLVVNVAYITGADCDNIVCIFVINSKFLGLGPDKNMDWKTPIVLIISKLSRTCYVIRTM